MCGGMTKRAARSLLGEHVVYILIPCILFVFFGLMITYTGKRGFVAVVYCYAVMGLPMALLSALEYTPPFNGPFWVIIHTTGFLGSIYVLCKRRALLRRTTEALLEDCKR